jgi:hypothetical protein
MSKLRHNARGDTFWVGKGLGNLWLTVIGVVVGACLLAYLMHGGARLAFR